MKAENSKARRVRAVIPQAVAELQTRIFEKYDGKMPGKCATRALRGDALIKSDPRRPPCENRNFNFPQTSSINLITCSNTGTVPSSRGLTSPPCVQPSRSAKCTGEA